VVQIHSPRPLQIPAFHWFTRLFPLRLLLVFVYQVCQLRSPARCVSLLSGSWLPAMPSTTMSTCTSPSQMRRRDGSGSPRSTKSSRSTRARLSHRISGPRTTTIPGSSKRPAIHRRFRPARGKDGQRSGTLRQDAGALSEPGQSRVGAVEFSARSQVRK
jgi:hypothetical protein